MLLSFRVVPRIPPLARSVSQSARLSSDAELRTRIQNEFNKPYSLGPHGGVILRDDYARQSINIDDYIATKKVMQRFSFDRQILTDENKSVQIGFSKKWFLHKKLNKVELTPERAFANIVNPVDGVSYFLRRCWASFNLAFNRAAEGEGVGVDFANISEGSRQASVVICQAIYKNDVSSLVRRGLVHESGCSAAHLHKLSSVVADLPPARRQLFNLTADDIIGVAPATHGPLHVMSLFPQIESGKKVLYLGYTVTCCALYKKDVLFDAVKDVAWLDGATQPSDLLRVPDAYEYPIPRLSFITLSFSHKLSFPVLEAALNGQKADFSDITFRAGDLRVHCAQFLML